MIQQTHMTRKFHKSIFILYRVNIDTYHLNLSYFIFKIGNQNHYIDLI